MRRGPTPRLRAGLRAARLRRGPPRARGAPRECATSCASNWPRSSCDASSAVRTCSFNSSNVRSPSSSSRSDALDRRAQLLAAGDVALQLGGPRDGALLQLARRLFEPLHLDRERAGALDERGVRGLGFRGDARLAGSPTRAPRTACAAPPTAARRPRAARFRCAGSTGALRPRAAPARAAPLPRSAARSRSAPACARRGRPRRPRAGDLQIEADDRLLLAMQLTLERRDRRLRRRDRDVEIAGLVAHPRERPPRSTRRARAAP